MNEIIPNRQNLIIYNTLDGKVSVTMMARDGNVWMNQKQMAELFATSKQNIGQHVANILRENELTLDSVVKNYFITAADGKSYEVTFYSLDMVLAVGFRVKGKRGTQFRIWANQHLKEFQNKDVLRNAGTISNKEMEAHVQTVYEQFNNRRKKTEAMLADQMDDEELKLLEQQIRERK